MSDYDLNGKYTEDIIVEGYPIADARLLSMELGVPAVSPATGSALAVAAAISNASAILEIGTGVGVSGLWLLSGAPGATLTSIDIEAELQQHARGFFNAAGVPASKLRLITGKATDLLSRLNEGSYDLVLIDAEVSSVIEFVEHGLRLLRPGGSLLVNNALWHSRVPNPANREPETVALRTLWSELASSPAVVMSLTPVGGGLLHIVRR